MTSRKTRIACVCAAIGALGVALPAVSSAEGTSDEWQFNTTIYGWLPGIGGDVSYPAGGGTSIDITLDQILDNLKFTAMGMFGAQKGDWGIGTDVIYMDLGNTKKQTQHLAVGGNELPADVTAKVTVGMQSWVWTTVGSYRVAQAENYSFDVVAGARMLYISSDTKVHLDGDISGIPLPSRDVKVDISDTLWDGIVGFKGRFAFGADNKWFIPYYADVGTGDAQLTWQLMGGVGYQYDWGALVAAWRYMEYDMSSKDLFQSLDINGPAIGVTLRF
jgi:hypothetical protein